MDKKIQIKALEIVIQNNGCVEWKDLKSKICSFYFSQKIKIPTDEKIVHNLDLLEENGKIIKIFSSPFYYYKVLTWGHYQVEPFYKKAFYFLMYRTHNLFSILAIIVSLISLYISIKNANFLK